MMHSIPARTLALLGCLAVISSPAWSLQSGAPAGLEQIRIPVGEFEFQGLAAGPAEGELILLLHGFPQTSYSYRNQIPVLAEAGYRAVAPDLRGYSPLARPAEVEAYAMAHLVQDVFGIADSLGYSAFHLVGHDWGGAIAWVVATRAPQRTISLTVLSTPHFAALGAALSDRDSEQSQRSSYFQVFGADDAEQRFLADDAALLRSVYQGGDLSQDEIQVYVDALKDPSAMRAALNYYTALNRGRSQPAAGSNSLNTPAAPAVRVPTLYVWSTEDRAFARETAEATRNHVAGPYRFEVLEGISHWVPEQAADSVNQLILEHLAGLPQ